MSIATINPATGETLKTFEALSDLQLEEKLQRAVRAFSEFKKVGQRRWRKFSLIRE